MNLEAVLCLFSHKYIKSTRQKFAIEVNVPSIYVRTLYVNCLLSSLLLYTVYSFPLRLFPAADMGFFLDGPTMVADNLQFTFSL
jgi:hypothetical protein